MEGGEHTNARRAARDEVACKLLVNAAGIVVVGKARLGLEGVGVEPVNERQIHAHAEHGILRRVQVHIDERRHDELVAVVDDLGVDMLRHSLFNAFDRAVVIKHEAAVLDDLKRAERGRGDEMAFENFHAVSLLFGKKLQKKKCPPGKSSGETPIAEPFGGSVETFAPCQRNYMSFFLFYI